MSRAVAGRPIKAGSLCALLLAGALFWTGSALSQSRSVPQPIIEKARGEMCVAETEVMRRNHGDFLKHQRSQAPKHPRAQPSGRRGSGFAGPLASPP